MKLSKLTPQQIRRYFEARIPDLPEHATGNVMVKCVFHEDGKASMSLDLERGFWKCHTGCGEGKMLEFEMRFSASDERAALEAIADAVGEKLLPLAGAATNEAKYEYFDERGKPLFEIIKKRLPDGKKTFIQRHKGEDGSWIYNLKGVRRVLYNVRNVLRSTEIYIVEGEKCVERLSEALTDYAVRAKASPIFAVTCNPGGAGKWLDEFSPYMAGKSVVVIADNDEPGLKHAARVAASVHPYALRLKLVQLPDLEAKGDVADYLETHTVEQLLTVVGKAKLYEPPKQETGEMFLSAPKFMAMVPDEVEWAVENVIQAGANGFFTANPKGGKSWAVVDLCLALATGTPWLGFNVPRRQRVALISREDNAALTGWRMRKLCKGRHAFPQELDEWLYINSRQQTKTLMLDNEAELQEVIGNMKRLRIEFAFFDVFNVLHSAEENDNTEMRRVLNNVSRVQAEVGCAVCLVHHWSKGNPDDTITQRLRGASAISGWAEWVIGISVMQEQLRKMEFDLKITESPEPVFYNIRGPKGDDWARLEVDHDGKFKESRERAGYSRFGNFND